MDFALFFNAVVKVVRKDRHRTKAASTVPAGLLHGVASRAAGKAAAAHADTDADLSATPSSAAADLSAAKASRGSSAGGRWACLLRAAGDIGRRPARAGGNGGLSGRGVPTGGLAEGSLSTVSHTARCGGLGSLFLRLR